VNNSDLCYTNLGGIVRSLTGQILYPNRHYHEREDGRSYMKRDIFKWIAVRASLPDYKTEYNQANDMVVFDHGYEDPDMDLKWLGNMLLAPTMVTQDASEETLKKAMALLGTSAYRH